ncbi:MAG: class I SAM-dependent methyltransferase [Rhodothermia bacterium]|nr:class I SAM-dependent methyltransferase [Rhodothermia bacterium]
MLYDPIKDRLGKVFTGTPLLQRLFYRILDVVFLRSWYVRRELRTIFDALAERQTVRVLDAGTGFGQYAYYMLRKFPRAQILAVDIKEDYVEMAASFIGTTAHAGRADFAVDDLTRLEATGPFDVILSVDVMEHIENDEGVFRNFERVLAPGGFVLINTPSDQGGSAVQDEGDQSFIGEHVRDGYSVSDLSAKLHRAGMTTVKAIYTYGSFGSTAWRISIQIPMMMLSATWLSLIILIPYYLIVLPFAIVLNALDVRSENKTGTGLLVLAQKGTGEVVPRKIDRVVAALN